MLLPLSANLQGPHWRWALQLGNNSSLARDVPIYGTRQQYLLMVKDVDMVELATENIPIIENRRRRRG